jgi:aspartate ammonia-lyase
LQVGSSIMPAKVNPVIPEFVVSVAHKIYSNDLLISSLCAQGCLELNAYLPIIGHSIIESLKLLIAANATIKENLLQGLLVNKDISEKKLFRSSSITTALVPYIGYNKSAEIAKYMKANNVSIFEANKELKFIDEQKLTELLKPGNLLKEGFSIEDLNT